MNNLGKKLFLVLASGFCLTLMSCEQPATTCCNKGQKKSLFGKKKSKSNCSNDKCKSCDCCCSAGFSQGCKSGSR